ncbi:hypothetical protein [Coleofasciculus sp. E1-EBD-02]|uniref:hypothetical protein n=1 Tax=Coleofasciculus sp. E1-EBD-02 TaxID=3068481 RepID=UPI0032FD9AC5
MNKPALFLVLLIDAVRVAPTPESTVIGYQVRSPSLSWLALIPDQKSDRLKHTSILSQGGFC